MNQTQFFVSILLLSTCSFSCGSNTGKHQNKADFFKFNTVTNLNETRICKLENIAADGLLLYHDSLLVIKIAPGKSGNHFCIWNINQQKLVSQILPFGREENQSLSFLSYGIQGNSLWVNDIMKEKMLSINLDSSGSKAELNVKGMPFFYYSVHLLNDSVVIGAGNYDDENKISLLNLYSGKITEQLISYHSGNLAPQLREEKSAFESFLFCKPSGEKAVLACRYADQIEIIDLKSKTSTIIKGPEGYNPDVMTVVGNDKKKMSTRNENTRYAFVKGKTTNDYVYLLYSGNNHMSDHLFYGNCLYVYDWNGIPVKKLNFNDDVLDFVVTSDNKLIYAYHPKSKFLTVSNPFK